MVFLAFLAGMGGCSVYGYMFGQPAKLFAPIDSDGMAFILYIYEGNICGYDKGYENYKYLYIWDLNQAVQNVLSVFNSAVCVTSCPLYNSTTGNFTINCKNTTYMKN